MVFRLALLVFFFSVRFVHGNCFKEDVTYASDILDILEPVANPYLCQSLCGDLEECSAFTWTTEDNPNFELSCFLFADATNQTTCNECISGPPSCTCLKEDVTYVSDILDILEPVANPYMCQSLCADLEECSAFTWTTEDNVNFELSCFLFADASNQTTCNECISGPPSCTCSSEVACRGDEDNILDAISGVKEEAECQDLCAGNTSCRFYTWYDSTNFPQYTCILLNSCDVTDNTCSGCFSGPPACPDQISTTTSIPTTNGILLSGGDGARTSVEVYVPYTGQSCSLPSLPEERHSHTMDSLHICGDYSPSTSSCLYFSSGQWNTSHTLVEQRSYHSSWQTDQGLVLMGGVSSPYTSEIVPLDGEQGGPSFAMQYSTMDACAMQDLTSDSVIISGGIKTMQLVSRYNLEGHLEDLPELVFGRYGHGCGSYLRLDGTQVLLVAGGDDGNLNLLSHTEVLTTDSHSWTMATPLPRAVYAARGMTIGNIVTLTGGRDGSYNERDEIIEWSDEEWEWVETGKMKMARYNHAMTTIQLDDPAMEHCG